ncbi:acetyl synthetase, partial [Raphidocelis subcapitata]
MRRIQVLAGQLAPRDAPADAEEPAAPAPLWRAPASAAHATQYVYDREPPVRDRAQYEAMHRRSLEDPAGFWADEAADYYFHKKWDPDHTSFNFDPSRGRVGITWFAGAQTNMAYNCLDRWVIAGAGSRAAFISEGNDIGHERQMSYAQALAETCRL